ncbi:MAG: hypothetical protein KDA33_12350, partial [Phycisphaerales bacterium]|nr:hypothetical protein [Phycisphaerales bacterium]
PLTKWADMVQHPDNIPEMVRKAFKLAECEKPGACLVELPEDIAEMEAEGIPIPPVPTRRPGPDPKALVDAVGLIHAAKNPIILAGNGCVRKRSSEQLCRFVTRTGIGVVNTFMGKGAIPRSSEHCLFTIGLQSRDHVSCIMDEADLVIAIGYDLVEYDPMRWNQGNSKKILHIDFLPAEVDDRYRADVELIGDIANCLHGLIEALGDLEKPLFDISRHAKRRAEMIADFDGHNDDETTGTIRPQKALADCRAVLGPGDLLLSDVGAHKMWVARHYHCDEPNTCLIPNGFCSMGFALPGAIASALVNPSGRTLAISGDAGFLMNVQEMETAKRLNLNLVVMVWEDHGYGLIKWKQ